MKPYFIALGIVVSAASAWADEGREESVDEMSLERLLELQTTVASDRSSTLREAPAIVTVVSKEEIQHSGARNLVDVLRLVPGFAFGTDVEGVVAPGFRGLWGQEGKILVRLDGQELNERMYSNLAFGNHFSVDQIKRIEIIRGPGSAIYGGFAELAVINIITRVGDEDTGLYASVVPGFMEGGFSRQNVTASFGHRIQPDLYLGASVFRGWTNASDQTYTDVYGDSYNMDTNARQDPTNINIGLRYKDLRFKFIFDDFHTTTRDGYDAILPSGPVSNDFRAYHAETSYEWKPHHRITIVPKFKFSRQSPWNSTELPPTDPVYYDATVDHYVGILRGSFDASEFVNVAAGGQLDYDAPQYSGSSLDVFPNGEKSITYYNVSAFSEASLYTPFINATVGLRFEDHSAFGSSVVPRIGLTKVVGPLHGKFLYSRAFRAPGIEQIRFGNNIQPEYTNVYEAEVGYTFSNSSLLTANYFEIHVDDPIVYRFDTTANQDTYVNLDRAGTRGVELEYRLHQSFGYAILNYSYYRTAGANPAIYSVPGHNDHLLGFPAHKVALHSHFSLFENFSVNPSVIFLSRRFGYDSVDASGASVLSEFDPAVLANLYFLYENALINRLDAGLGVYDIFNEKLSFIQPYDGLHAPLPGPSREYFVKLTYRWPE